MDYSNRLNRADSTAAPAGLTGPAYRTRGNEQRTKQQRDGGNHCRVGGVGWGGC